MRQVQRVSYSIQRVSHGQVPQVDAMAEGNGGRAASAAVRHDVLRAALTRAGLAAPLPHSRCLTRALSAFLTHLTRALSAFLTLSRQIRRQVEAEIKAEAAQRRAKQDEAKAKAKAKRKAEADAKREAEQAKQAALRVQFELHQLRLQAVSASGPVMRSPEKATLSVSDLLSASGPVMRSPEKATPLSESELLELYSALSRQMPDSALSRHAGSPAIQLSPAVPFPCSPSATFAWPW